MEKTEFIWMNGKLIPWDNAKIHVLTHALHYGSGVFEGIRVYNTKKGPAIFRLKEHIDRLFSSAKSLHIEMPYSKQEIENAIKLTLRKNKIKEGYIRPIIFYGSGKMGLNPVGAKIETVIATWPWPAYIGESATVCTSSYIRIHPKSLKADKKVCGHYVNSILASLEAKQKGYNEAILLDSRGNIAEGPGENIFLIKQNKIYTPPLNKQILPGITRDSIIRLARELGYDVIEKTINPDELKQADELFFTGTAAELTPITKLDEKEFKIGEITKQLKQTYLDTIHGKNNHKEWLDFIN